MEISAGTYTFGPENGSLWVKTERGGAAAVAGHDLVIEVTAWEATFEIGPDLARSSVTGRVDSTSLRVREGFGGMQPLDDADKENIRETIDAEVLMATEIEFRSTSVSSSGEGLSVEGELTLMGNVHALAFELAVDDGGRLSSTFVLKQSDWGMQPYSALFGALKVADDVEITANAVLPGAESGFFDEMPDWTPPEIEYRQIQILDAGVSSFIWAAVFFLYLWLGMAAVGVSGAAAFTFSLVAACFIFLWVRTRGIGRQNG